VIGGCLDRYSRFSDIARVYAHRPPPDHPPLVAETELYVFGDPAYAPGFGVLGPYKRYPGRPFTPEEQMFNTQMSKKRISVEWSFGEILKRWHFVAHKYKLHLVCHQLVLTMRCLCFYRIYMSVIMVLNHRGSLV
jgi:hypothetical protein